MKQLSLITGPILLAILMSGCFIQSFQPFYTEDSLIKLPAIQGKWLLVKKGDENVAQKYPQPWVFGEDEITTFEDNVGSVLNVQYFMVKDMTFVDLEPSEPDKDKGINRWWTIHTIPVHSVCKVDLSPNSLNLTPLDGDWVEKMLEKKKVSVSYVAVGSEGDHIILTSPPERLMAFLKQYGNNTNAFPNDTSHSFQRMKEKRGQDSNKSDVGVGK